LNDTQEQERQEDRVLDVRAREETHHEDKKEFSRNHRHDLCESSRRLGDRGGFRKQEGQDAQHQRTAETALQAWKKIDVRTTRAARAEDARDTDHGECDW